MRIAGFGWSGQRSSGGSFDAGRIRANIRVQNARQEQTLAAYEKTVLTSFEEVENSLIAYAKEQIRRRSLEDAVKSSQDSLYLANQLYSNGLVSFINVLDAERSVYLAEDALADSDRFVTQDLISLYKSLGGGWETLERPFSSRRPGQPGAQLPIRRARPALGDPPRAGRC